VTIVMGLDQHRAQITAEWLDTSTGELSRSGSRPAIASGCGDSSSVFAASGSKPPWRRRRVGASWSRSWVEWAPRRAWPSRRKPPPGAAPRSAPSQTAPTLATCVSCCWPAGWESWIPPHHILDLRARVRLRHTLVDQRGEWQQRLQAVLYHHGAPWRNADRRRGPSLARRPGAAGRREQITTALAMVDALEAQLAPLDRELRAYARPARLSRADGPLWGRAADLGHDPCRARRAGRFSCSREAVRYGDGHHGAPIGCASRTRPSVATGPTGIALGAL